jgi:hypothetical protein
LIFAITVFAKTKRPALRSLFVFENASSTAIKRRLAIKSSCRRRHPSSAGLNEVVLRVGAIICSPKSACLEHRRCGYEINTRTRSWPARKLQESVGKSGLCDISDQYNRKYPFEDNGQRGHYALHGATAYRACCRNPGSGLNRSIKTRVLILIDRSIRELAAVVADGDGTERRPVCGPYGGLHTGTTSPRNKRWWQRPRFN